MPSRRSIAARASASIRERTVESSRANRMPNETGERDEQTEGLRQVLVNSREIERLYGE